MNSHNIINELLTQESKYIDNKKLHAEDEPNGKDEMIPSPISIHSHVNFGEVIRQGQFLTITNVSHLSI